MTRVLVVDAPETDEVRPGTLWLMPGDWLLLVLAPITDDVFNVVYWPDGENVTMENAEVSMMGADVLVMGAERQLADPLPVFLDMLGMAWS